MPTSLPEPLRKTEVGPTQTDVGECAICGELHPQASAYADSASLIQQGFHLLNKYRLLEIIAEGGFGTVFLAEHTELEESRVIKRLKPEFSGCPEFSRRFLTEGKVARRVKSEYVCEVFDVGHDDIFGYYLIMEHLRGRPLSTYVLDKNGIKQPQPFWVVKHVMYWVLRGLEIIHREGIAHRDLKPDNIFIIEATDGSTQHVAKILDFGIAKVPRQLRSAGHVHRPTRAMGTPEYMAPEQLYDMPNTDLRADIWAIGVILYELLTGKYPYQDRDGVLPHQAAMKHLLDRTPLPPLGAISRLTARCNVDAVMAIIRRCLEPERGQRYGSAHELWRDIKAVDIDLWNVPQAAGKRSSVERWDPRHPLNQIWQRLEPPEVEDWEDLGDRAPNLARAVASQKGEPAREHFDEIRQPATVHSNPINEKKVSAGVQSSAIEDRKADVLVPAKTTRSSSKRTTASDVVILALTLASALLTLMNVVIIIIAATGLGLQSLAGASLLFVAWLLGRAVVGGVVGVVLLSMGTLFISEAKLDRHFGASFVMSALIVATGCAAYSLVSISPVYWISKV